MQSRPYDNQISSEDQSSRESLPPEVLHKILSSLPLKDAARARFVNRTFNSILKDNLFWIKKYQQHFPDRFKSLEKLLNKEDLNWFDEFRDTFNQNYEGFFPHSKQRILAIKDGLWQGNEGEKWLHDMLKDGKAADIIMSWASCKQDEQALLDAIYAIVIKNYSVGLSINVLKTEACRMTILHWAVFCHQPAAVIESLIEQGADVNAARITDRATSLYLAAREGHLDIVQLLLAKNANVNITCDVYDSITPLYIAVERGHLAIVQLLLEKNAYHSGCMRGKSATPLHCAAAKGRLDIAKELIENVKNKANVNATCLDGTTPLHWAAANGHLNIVKLLLANNANVNATSSVRTTPLLSAVQQSHFEIVKFLLENKANVNTARNDGLSPLHSAAENGDHDMVELLLANNADVKATCIYKSKSSNKKSTPLYIAVDKGHQEIVKLLLTNNADVNAGLSDGTTPLYNAAENGRADIVKLLLTNNAKVNAVCVYKNTALLIATTKGHPAVVALLLAAGANVNQTGKDMQTPLFIASRGGNHVACIDLLLEFGAGLYGKMDRLPKGVQTAGKVAIGLTIASQPITANTPGFETAITNLMQFNKAVKKNSIAHPWALLKLCADPNFRGLSDPPTYLMLRAIKFRLYNLTGLKARCLYGLLAATNQPVREQIYQNQTNLSDDLANSLKELEKKGLRF